MVDITIEVNNEKIKRIPKMQNNNNYSNIIIITTSISYFYIFKGSNQIVGYIQICSKLCMRVESDYASEFLKFLINQLCKHPKVCTFWQENLQFLHFKLFTSNLEPKYLSYMSLFLFSSYKMDMGGFAAVRNKLYNR